jgi:hypothetical protein
MNTKLIAALLPCIFAVQSLNAQVAGVPVRASDIMSGLLSSGVYDVVLRDGTRQTGNVHSNLDKKGNGVITSWPDGGPVTITRVHNGNAVIFGPSH